jgi:V/A-type H+-transporting ATPase subunit E
MDIQLQELIEKIKTDGVQSAEQQAETIVADARKRAEEIVAEAKKKGDDIRREAKRDADQTTQAGEEALVQAGRDLILSLEKKITRIFDEVVRSETADTLKGKGLEEVLVALVQGWAEKQNADVTALLSKDDFAALEGSLRSRLAAELKKGVEIKPVDSVDAGFLIEEKGGSSYYNFTAEGLAEILAEFVNPRLEEALRRAAAREE